MQGGPKRGGKLFFHWGFRRHDQRHSWHKMRVSAGTTAAPAVDKELEEFLDSKPPQPPWGPSCLFVKVLIEQHPIFHSVTCHSLL